MISGDVIGRADGPRVLFVPSNGMGLGHMTRAAAIARRLGEAGAMPILCVLSPLIDPLRQLGFMVEHIPSYASTPLERWHWQRLLADQLRHLIEAYEITAVVFDGVAPYRGVRQVMAEEGAPPFVWIRRGRWRADARPAATAAGFTMVIEPGEVDRDEADVGIPPPAARSVNGVPVRRVGPVLLHDHHDLCDRARALADLDLPADGRYGLISLGTGLAGPLAHTAGPLVTALRNRGLVPVVAASPLSPPPTVEGALVRQRYPLAPSLAAFDVVVLAAGYNSVVEAVACRAPAVLVPNPAAAVDDQLARAVALDQQGLAVLWDSTGRAGAEGAAGPGPAGGLDRALDRALDGRAELVERMAARAVPQGATRAAALVQELAQSRAHQPRRRSIR